MTQQEYIKQNEKGFEGDTILHQTFKDLCKKHKIKHIIETGTYLGHTTKHLSKMCKKVDTIEVVKDNYDNAMTHLSKLKKVTQHLGSSEKVLENILPESDEGLFIFLDAHWNEYNPLLDELKVIANKGLKPIIAIHDFKVPNRPELGFDVYNRLGIVYEWNWIYKSIEAIYGVGGYEIEYNSEATGAKRGVIFIYPVTNK